jgi:hypothetical protein
VLAWEPDAGSVLAELYQDGDPEALATMSNPQLGPIDAAGLAAAQDDHGDSFVAFVQGSPARIVVGAEVPKPGAVRQLTPTKTKQTRPELSWSAAADVFSAIHYEVLLDGAAIATAITATHFRVPTPLAPGLHRWQVIASDGFGQERIGSVRPLRIA